jgi:hypothetical protein
MNSDKFALLSRGESAANLEFCGLLYIPAIPLTSHLNVTVQLEQILTADVRHNAHKIPAITLAP